MNLGAWEGMLSGEVEAQYPRELEERTRDPFHSRAPDGESPRDVAERVVAALDEIAAKHPNQSVLIVAHGLSLAVVICHAQGIPLNKVFEHIPENAKLYRVTWDGE
jgi:broad specificity phosphatase PhoE